MLAAAMLTACGAQTEDVSADLGNETITADEADTTIKAETTKAAENSAGTEAETTAAATTGAVTTTAPEESDPGVMLDNRTYLFTDSSHIYVPHRFYCVKNDDKLYGYVWDEFFNSDSYSGDVIAENVRSVYEFDDRILYIKNDNSLWAFGANNGSLSGELNPDAVTTDDKGFKVYDKIIDPEDAIQVGTDVAAIATRDTGIRGYILTTDGSFYDLSEYLDHFKGTPLAASIKSIVDEEGVYEIFDEVLGNLTKEDANGRDPLKAYLGRFLYKDPKEKYTEYWFTTKNGNVKNTENSMIIVFDDVKNAFLQDANIFVIKNDNTLWGMGRNGYGQLGTGEKTDYVYTPVLIAENVQAFYYDEYIDHYSGNYVTTDGKVMMWSDESPEHVQTGTDESTYVIYEENVRLDTNGKLTYIKKYDNGKSDTFWIVNVKLPSKTPSV